MPDRRLLLAVGALAIVGGYLVWGWAGAVGGAMAGLVLWVLGRRG